MGEDNSYLSTVKNFLKEYSLFAGKDQFFLVDQIVIDKMVKAAHISKSDRVLEIGPGLGFLTKALAQEAKEVIAIEIDERFKPYLDKLPPNVAVIYGDAYRLLNNKKFLWETRPPTKTVSSIPYSQAQNMLHNYTNYSWYQGDLVWLAPLSLANKVNQEPILGAYFQTKILERVSKSSFFPEPNTISAIIYFARIPNPKITGNFSIYLRRWLYNHEDIKVRNALREGIITAADKLKGRKVTKNNARTLITGLRIPQANLDALTSNIPPTYYVEVPKKLQRWFDDL